MAPPIPAHVKRFTANPTRPARYRPGKAIPEESSDEEDDNDDDGPEQEVKIQSKPRHRPSAPATTAAKVKQEEEDEDDDEGFVTEDEGDDLKNEGLISSKKPGSTGGSAQTTSSHLPTPSNQAGLQSRQERVPTQSNQSSGSEDSDEDESEEEESSSEDEAPQRKFQRPIFVKKGERKSSVPLSQSKDDNVDTDSGLAILSSRHGEDVAARRLAEAESLIKTTIERDTAARLAGKKSWDDDDDLPPEALVDDTDGLDPEAEHSAWRLREMHRLRRDREAMIAREKELEEVERRRNLTAEEREAEDRDFIAKQKDEKEQSRGKAAFLSRYHHKGAFFMDDETSERLARRDLAGAKFADEVADKSTLPEYMRIRDMTKLGKKGRTRYTDLKDQDTGRFGNDVKRWKGSGYGAPEDTDKMDYRGMDERFLPDDDQRGRGPRASGANASSVGERRIRRRSNSRSDNERYRPRRRSYSRSRSRSRSPRRKPRRPRSPSPYLESDKRRRIQA